MIHWNSNTWFDSYSSNITSTEKHSTGYLILHPLSPKDPQGLYLKSNTSSCDLILADKPFGYSILIKYTLFLPPTGQKIGINISDDTGFNISHIDLPPPIFPNIHKITHQFHTNTWIVETQG